MRLYVITYMFGFQYRYSILVSDNEDKAKEKFMDNHKPVVQEIESIEEYELNEVINILGEDTYPEH